MRSYFFLAHGPHLISYFFLKDMPIIHEYHRSLIDLLYSSMDGVHLPKITIRYLIVSSLTWGHHLYFCKKHPMCIPHLSFLLGIASLPTNLFNTLVKLPWYHVSIACTTSEPVQYPGVVAYTYLYL